MTLSDPYIATLEALAREADLGGETQRDWLTRTYEPEDENPAWLGLWMCVVMLCAFWFCAGVALGLVLR